jgi:hypothetical protein
MASHSRRRTPAAYREAQLLITHTPGTPLQYVARSTISRRRLPQSPCLACHLGRSKSTPGLMTARPIIIPSQSILCRRIHAATCMSGFTSIVATSGPWDASCLGLHVLCAGGFAVPHGVLSLIVYKHERLDSCIVSAWGDWSERLCSDCSQVQGRFNLCSYCVKQQLV